MISVKYLLEFPLSPLADTCSNTYRTNSLLTPHHINDTIGGIIDIQPMFLHSEEKNASCSGTIIDKKLQQDILTSQVSQFEQSELHLQ